MGNDSKLENSMLGYGKFVKYYTYVVTKTNLNESYIKLKELYKNIFKLSPKIKQELPNIHKDIIAKFKEAKSIYYKG